jgi:uridylate kinase
MGPKYKRVVLKISGEALSGGSGFGVDPATVAKITENLKLCASTGTQIAIVVGAGNFWRGRSAENMDKSRADHMGMLATVMNSLVLMDSLEKAGIQARVLTAIEMTKIAAYYTKDKAAHHLNKNRVVIIPCGTGNPFFSTDSGAALRAAELEADVMLFAKSVDGVYEADPKESPGARMYKSLGHIDIIKENLGVMDLTAASLCMENDIPILVFALGGGENIRRALLGEDVGTLIARGIPKIFK